MSLGWVIAGTFGQCVLGFFVFMLVAFSGGGMSEKTLSSLQLGVFNVSMVALPLSCVLSAGIVLYLYNTGAGASAYGWYGLPLVLTGLYLWFAVGLTG